MAQKTFKLLFNCQKSCKDNTNNAIVRVILIIKIYKRLVKNNTTIQLDFFKSEKYVSIADII